MRWMRAANCVHECLANSSSVGTEFGCSLIVGVGCFYDRGYFERVDDAFKVNCLQTIEEDAYRVVGL